MLHNFFQENISLHPSDSDFMPAASSFALLFQGSPQHVILLCLFWFNTSFSVNSTTFQSFFTASISFLSDLALFLVLIFFFFYFQPQLTNYHPVVLGYTLFSNHFTIFDLFKMFSLAQGIGEPFPSFFHVTLCPSFSMKQVLKIATSILFAKTAFTCASLFLFDFAPLHHLFNSSVSFINTSI